MQINLNLKEKASSYKIYINELERLELKGKVGIVTNAKVAGLHLEKLLSVLKCDEKFIISVPDGEEYKNLETIEQILEQLFVSKFDRSSTLIAIGGGVISDMTGFAASIYERGISFINIPTTLLAQVDASVGGKTGVNNKFGKNLIGSFYQPKAVFCEINFLKTLPKREFAAGVAEALKMAVTFDKEMFSWLKSVNLDDENLAKLVEKSINLKARVVEQDEKEKGDKSHPKLRPHLCSRHRKRDKLQRIFTRRSGGDRYEYGKSPKRQTGSHERGAGRGDQAGFSEI